MLHGTFNGYHVEFIYIYIYVFMYVYIYTYDEGSYDGVEGRVHKYICLFMHVNIYTYCTHTYCRAPTTDLRSNLKSLFATDSVLIRRILIKLSLAGFMCVAVCCSVLQCVAVCCSVLLQRIYSTDFDTTLLYRFYVC